MRKLLLSAVVMLFAQVAAAATLRETIDKTFDVRPGATVELTNTNGRVTVKAWDQPRVKVVAVKEVETDRDQLQKAMQELRVEMTAHDGGLTIKTRYPNEGNGGSFFGWLSGDDVDAEVTYELMVPRTMNVNVENTNGAIHVSDITGKHDLDTTNGAIEVKRCSGSLDATTTNGGINAELTRVTKGQPMRFETTNGRIVVAVPSDFSGELDASTTNGAISTDLPVTTRRAGENSLRGTINGGGTLLRMRTTNGGIALRTLGNS
jgi:DUF4097 and DUF4098 domain-containing protein YvlB